MSVRKRTWRTSKGEAKEAWIVHYADQHGVPHIKTFERKKDADAYQAIVKVDVSKGMHVPASQSLTISEAADVWINRVEADERERTTVRQYRQHVSLHIAPRIGGLKLAQLTPAHIEAFRDDLLKSLSRALARKVLTSLKSLLKASKYGHLASDVRMKVDKRSERKLEIGRDIPSSGEVKRMIEATAESKHRALLMTAALTGLRASELRGLRWSDVDFKEAELHVRQRADRYNKIGPPKSASSRRSIPLGPQILSALKVWKLACPKGEGDFVFPTSTGKVDHHANMLRGLNPVMARAGLTDKRGRAKYALHSFRHYFASWCINPKDRGGRELSPKVVQGLLGHSSIVMTLDRYGHLFPRGDDRAELAAAETAMFA